MRDLVTAGDAYLVASGAARDARNAAVRQASVSELISNETSKGLRVYMATFRWCGATAKPDSPGSWRAARANPKGQGAGSVTISQATVVGVRVVAAHRTSSAWTYGRPASDHAARPCRSSLRATRAMRDQRARLLRTALGLCLVPLSEPELRLLHRWLDCWRGVGDVVTGDESARLLALVNS